MPEITSPLGRRVVGSSTPRPSLIVPDEEPMSDAELKASAVELEKLELARKQAMDNRKKISSPAKERIEFLTGLGRAKVDVDFEGVKFSLQSLKSGEMRNVLLAAASGQTNADSAFLIRTHTLAYSLTKVDGQLIDLILGISKDSKSLDALFNAKLKLIEDMEEELVEFLNASYSKMVQENKKKFVIETTEEAREVAEDLKK